MKVSVGIKALNEEGHIAAALASAVTAAKPFDGEVILADSGSTDRTLEIAREFDVRIVMLANRDERSCGTGAQLAFQHAMGEFFYLLDGDMVLDPGFLAAGIAYLEAHPEAAAVGGRVREQNVVGEEFQIRAASVQANSNWAPGEVDRLDCGGLYRRSAVLEVGYFADRNLHAFEEFDLGARLRSRGWKLARIDAPAVDHFGHTTGGYRLLWRRMKSGYSAAPGEVLRAALGERHLPLVLRNLGHVRNGVAVMLWWGLLAVSLLLPYAPAGTLLLLLAPLVLLTFRRGSFRLGLYSFAMWNANALGVISGFARRRISPDQPIAAVDFGRSQGEA